MALINRPFPGLFGGVTQQVPILREGTQCEVMDNAYASVADGLNKRPGLNFIGQAAANAEIASHVIDQGPGNRFWVHVRAVGGDTPGTRSGDIAIYDMDTGAQHTVNTSTIPNPLPYLDHVGHAADAFRFVTEGDTTWVLNTQKIPSFTNTNISAQPATKFFRVVKAVAGVRYRVVPDGVLVGDYLATSTDTTVTIAAALLGQLATYYGAGATVITGGDPDRDTVLLQKTAGSFSSFECSDGFGGQALINLSTAVKDPAYLPVGGFSPNAIKIAPAGTTDASYWVKWDSFEKRYVESIAATGTNISYSPVDLSMPITLRRTGATTWYLSCAGEGSGGWAVRPCGTDTSNPAPSFFGKRVVDIFFVRNRLGLLHEDGVVLSSSGNYLNFWGRSQRTVLDDDPIDLDIQEDGLWAVEWNNKMIFFTREGQWTLTGDPILTPKTAKLVPTSRYETNAQCRPVTAGDAIYFATETALGGYSRVHRYTVSPDTGELNQAEDLTAHVPSYLQGSPHSLHISTTEKMLLLTNRQNPRITDVFKWETAGDKILQTAWGKWKWVPDGAIANTHTQQSFHFVGSKLYSLSHKKFNSLSLTDIGRQQFAVMDFNDVRKPKVGTAFNIWSEFFLDFKVTCAPQTGTYVVDALAFPGYPGYTEFQLPFAITANQFSWSCGNPPSGLSTAVPAATVGLLMYVGGPVASSKVRLAGNWADTTRTLTWGANYVFQYRFSQPFPTGRDNAPLAAARFVLRKYDVRYENSGFFQTLVTPYLRPSETQTMNGFTIGSQAVNQYGLATGMFSIPLHTTPEGLAVDIISDSLQPLRVPYAEWTGSIVQRAMR